MKKVIYLFKIFDLDYSVNPDWIPIGILYSVWFDLIRRILNFETSWFIVKNFPFKILQKAVVNDFCFSINYSSKCSYYGLLNNFQVKVQTSILPKFSTNIFLFIIEPKIESQAIKI